jgi:hypothetical protein
LVLSSLAIDSAKSGQCAKLFDSRDNLVDCLLCSDRMSAAM